MPVLNVKKDGAWKDIASSYTHAHTVSDITDLPASLVDDIEFLKDKVGADSIAYQINTAIEANVYKHPYTHPADMITGLSNVAISGDYNDLTNLPEIPDKYTHPDTHPANMITGLATVATSGSYNDLTNKPTIPSIVGLATKTYVDEQIASIGNSSTGGGGTSTGGIGWNDFTDIVIEEIDLFVNQTVDGFSSNPSYYGLYTRDFSFPESGYLNNLTDSFSLSIDEDYIVEWDGIEYEVTAFDASSVMLGVVALGNGSAFGLGGNMDAPFIVAVIKGQGVNFLSLTEQIASHTIRVYKREEPKRLIKTNLLPDTNQPDWNECDKSSDTYIQNRPFGLITAGTVIAEENDVYCNIPFEGLYVAIIPIVGFIVDAAYTIEIDGQSFSCVSEEDYNNVYGIACVCTLEDGVSIGIIDNFNDTGMSVLATTTQGMHTYKITAAENIIQKIDSKYLPNNIPEVNTEDNGKVMTVVNGVWTAQTPASGLPKVTTSDAGKFLRVGLSGAWVVESIPNAEGASF